METTKTVEINPNMPHTLKTKLRIKNVNLRRCSPEGVVPTKSHCFPMLAGCKGAICLPMFGVWSPHFVHDESLESAEKSPVPIVKLVGCFGT